MTPLSTAWSQLLPGCEQVGAELLARWSEPHRHYHDLSHLTHSLAALRELGGTARAERLALWFHDAIYTGRPGNDEHDSARLASDLLTGAGLPTAEVQEVHRLVLVTIDHAPDPTDGAGARVSDADLAILGAEPARYLASVASLRAESGTVHDRLWRTSRLARVAELLAADPLFHTAAGRSRWLAAARANLVAEQRSLLAGRG